ncbi:hypothetical protein BFP72_02710 [Reichenbachiella sp. 5M10]|uniref:hypothetical protein n=1 Tax=Reichenbachiella sp. 5M10 TaxID=1889772 RepID=UPI000C695178|nr:hypothetical protein [Reichenbachiella sp. 5M10]PIB34406.1 hypothetical protein BFP72_02710 [Reichenbachiella sp. 5M10]
MKFLIMYWAMFFAMNFGPGFDAKQVYQALEGDSMEKIQAALKVLGQEPDTPKNRAYIGALTAKEAGLLKGVGDKVRAFKTGAEMLETEIKNDPTQVEFRFLRLAIQEESPAILGYKDNIEEDKAMIVDYYSKLPSTLRKQIKHYAATSEYLTVDDLR